MEQIGCSIKKKKKKRKKEKEKRRAPNIAIKLSSGDLEAMKIVQAWMMSYGTGEDRVICAGFLARPFRFL